MARSIRLLYRGVQGRIRQNFNWPPIKANSAVVVSAAEWAPNLVSTTIPVPGTSLPLAPPTGRPHLGEANVYVTNVGPHGPEGGDGGVEFHLHVDFPSPLPVVVTISVLEDVEAIVQL